MIQPSQYEALRLRFDGLSCAEQMLVVEETKKAVRVIREVCYTFTRMFHDHNDAALKHSDACKTWVAEVNMARSDELQQIREGRKRV